MTIWLAQQRNRLADDCSRAGSKAARAGNTVDLLFDIPPSRPKAAAWVRHEISQTYRDHFEANNLQHIWVILTAEALASTQARIQQELDSDIGCTDDMVFRFEQMQPIPKGNRPCAKKV